MDKIFTNGSWSKISGQIPEDLPKSAAVAYVSKGSPLKFGSGDILICDASVSAIKNGNTDAKTLLDPPYMVNRASMIGTGNFPKFEDAATLGDDDLLMIPTAEVPVTNLYRDEILDGADLTLKLRLSRAASARRPARPARTPAGSFESISSTRSRWSNSRSRRTARRRAGEHDCRRRKRLENARASLSGRERMLWRHGIQGRQAIRPRGMGPGRRQVPGDLSSCSNFEAFQARRAGIRFRRAQGGKPEFVRGRAGPSCASFSWDSA